MRVSLNEIKQYIDGELPPVDELVKRINEQLGGVEDVIDFGDIYKDAVIVRVVSCEKHPNADKLHVCLIDDNGVVKDVERGNDGLVKVVCGAPNVHAGMLAIWLPPRAVVPSTYHDDEPFVLGARELRGEMSNGMLASPKELGLGDSHEGILELDANEWKPISVEIKAGTSFATAYGLDDQIIDIENKMFTHRPDLFGQLGVAREVAGITGKTFVSPNWYKDFPKFNKGSGLDLTISNDAQDVVPRFMAVAIKDVKVKPSPTWLQAELVRLGGKPINNIVDVTNYVMLLTAQPTHAYDYDKLRGHKLGARLARNGEKAELLNGKTYELTESDIVIVDGEGIVGLGGVMGGGNSEVSNDTKNIVLEVANFDMYAIRKSSMRHGLFTDAVTRFNKGQSPLQNPYVLNLLLKSVLDVAGGVQASEVEDKHDELNDVQSVKTTPEFINSRLGLSLDAKEIETLLSNVEFAVDTNDGERWFKAPFWRTDIELPEDIVEEVGRLYGFDKLPRELPQRSIEPATLDSRLQAKRLIRRSLKQSGANEVLTYSFVHRKLLEKANQDDSEAFGLSNALSPDLQYYRLSLLPSLLDKVRPNIKNGFDEFVLYELGKGHNKRNVDEQGLPNETELLELVYASKQSHDGALFYKVRRIIDQLCKDAAIEVTYQPITESLDYPGASVFEQSRSAFVMTKNGQTLGIVGELKQSVRQGFKLPDTVAAASLSFASFHEALEAVSNTYLPLSRFPAISQDISLVVAKNVSYADVYASAQEAVKQDNDESLQLTLSPISIYRADGSDTKTITLRLRAVSYEKTLTDDDVKVLIERISEAAKRTHKAETI